MFLIGTSGYKYEDWVRIFYPSAKETDELAFYAGRFSCVELTGTFFAFPSRFMTANMAEKVPANFRFVVKAHRSLTHDQSLEPAVAFRAALAPLVDAGQLAAITAQFPFRFRFGDSAKQYVLGLQAALGLPLLLELPHPSWSDQEAFQFLEEHQLGFCCLDRPLPRGAALAARVTSRIGCLKLYGRDADKWFSRTQSERYSYTYTREELEEWVPRLRAMEPFTDLFFIFFANHPDGRALKNAADLAELLGTPIELPKAEEYDKTLSKFF